MLPKTRFGKLSIILLAAFFSSFAVFQFMIALGQRGGQKFFSNLLLAIPGLLMAILGTTTFFAALIGIIKEKERSILVFLAAAIGLFVFLFCLAEILFPH